MQKITNVSSFYQLSFAIKEVQTAHNNLANKAFDDGANIGVTNGKVDTPFAEVLKDTLAKAEEERTR